MACESHKHKHKAADAQTQRKSSKHSKHHKYSSKSATNHSEKMSEAIRNPSKSKKTTSAAGVFKRAKHASKKHRKRKERTPTPEPDLSKDLRDGIGKARAAIDSKLHASFETAHTDFLRQLAESRSRDMAFFESISATANLLAAPLSDEQIETTFIREGKPVTEIVEIGKRIAQFKKSVEKDDAKLKNYWEQWEELQDDYVELGIEVFGPEVFDGAADEAREKGYKKDMAVLDVEHGARVQELKEEVENISEQILMKMKESEKELDTSARKQQAKLLQALISD